MLLLVTVCGFKWQLKHVQLLSVCDQPFNSMGSCVGNVDNVLHNSETFLV